MGGDARGDEGHEGHEEGVRSAREAARVLREDREDGDRAEEDRLGEEQVGEDREQEEEPCGEEELVDRGLQQGARGLEDLGEIVSRKKSLAGKKNSWIVACNKARAALKIKGFTVIKKGTPLYKKAKEFLA